MPITRRSLLFAAPALSALGSCATDLTAYRERPLAGLAAELGICAAAYATVKAGVPDPAVVLSGCVQPTAATPEPIFQAASLTKPVVAFAALQLVLAGRLDLDAPVSRYLPGGYVHFHGVLARAAGDPSDTVATSVLSALPVATLLNHSSGLPNWAGGELAAEFSPGERWGYSGEGYLMLQAVIEAVVGTDLSTWADRQVFGPLGMRDSSLVWNDAMAGRMPAAEAGFWSPRPARFLAPVAAASLATTATDYARFLAAWLADERLTSLALSRTVTTDRTLGLDWGLGWGIERTADGPMLWQWGNNPGYRAFTMVSPVSKDGFVLLTASDRGMPLAVPLAHRVLPGPHHAFRFPWVG